MDIAAAQKAAGPGVTIIPVKTLDEALAALEKIGGDKFVPPAHDSGSGGTADPTPDSVPTSAPTLRALTADCRHRTRRAALLLPRWPCRCPVPTPRRPTPSPSATFSTGRRGFDQNEVRDFLRMVAAELARLQERERYLDRELRTAQRGGPNPAVALDEEVVTKLLGEEAARILATSREAATQIKVRAEDAAARIVARRRRRGPAHPRGGPDRGAPVGARTLPPTPRASWRWPSSRAARWSTRRGRTASGCSPS